MLSYAVTVLLAVAAQPSVVPEPHSMNLSGLFVAACLDGEARLPAGEVAKIAFDEVPSALKQRLRHPASGDIWRVRSSQSYLYMLDYKDTPGDSPKICGLASDNLDLPVAVQTLNLRLSGGGSLQQAVRSMQWVNAKDGYIVTATRASGFDVLQVNWLGEKERKRLTDEADQLAH